MEGEESWKKEYNGDDQKRFLEKIWGTSDDEEDDFGVKKYQISEEAVVEMMRCLANEIGLGGSPPTSPSQETAFATVNGNEESCGPSFSSPASSVMASIDTSGAAGGSCFGGGTVDPAAPLFWPWNESTVEDGGHWEPPACAITAADEEDEDLMKTTYPKCFLFPFLVPVCCLGGIYWILDPIHPWFWLIDGIFWFLVYFYFSLRTPNVVLVPLNGL